MRRFIAAIPLAFVFAGCAGGTTPAAAPSDTPERLRCDRLAARAIQAADPGEAAALTAQSSECYAALQPAP